VKKHRIAAGRIAAAALTLLLVGAAPVAAITYGEPDAGEHPYVGYLITFNPVDPGWVSCSGALLDARTFLTAGHCVFNTGTNGALVASSGGNDAWVAIDESIDLSSFPRRADYPDEASLYVARSTWLEGDDSFTRGTVHAHPDFNDFAEFPINHDVGVVKLDDDVTVSRYAGLAPSGTLDELADTAKDHNKVLIDSVGYGVQSYRPEFAYERTRYRSTSTIVNLRSHLTDGYNVHTSNNPSPANGRGGSCSGDSGGPLLLSETDTVVAVVSFGFNPNCKGADYAARTDIEDSLAFIVPYLED